MLTLEDDGQFGWEVTTRAEARHLGPRRVQGRVLALLQEEGPPLVGKIAQDDANKFVFAPDGAGEKAPGLTFTR